MAASSDRVVAALPATSFTLGGLAVVRDVDFETTQRQQMLRLLGRYRQFSSMSAEEGEQATAEWNDIVRSLVGPIARFNRAAHVYVFGPEAKPWWRRLLPA